MAQVSGAGRWLETEAVGLPCGATTCLWNLSTQARDLEVTPDCSNSDRLRMTVEKWVLHMKL